MTKRKRKLIMNDALSRDVLIHVTADGTTYYRRRCERVFADPTLVVDNGWRDIAADALREGAIERAQHIIDTHRYGPDNPDDPGDAHESKSEGEWGLPVFSVDTIDQAKALIVHFCELHRGNEKLPDGQPRYILNRSFLLGDVSALWAIGKIFAMEHDKRATRSKRKARR